MFGDGGISHYLDDVALRLHIVVGIWWTDGGWRWIVSWCCSQCCVHGGTHKSSDVTKLSSAVDIFDGVQVGIDFSCGDVQAGVFVLHFGADELAVCRLLNDVLLR